MSEYVVIYEQDSDGGWGAYLPDVPGVVALGESREEVAAGIQEAIDAYADKMRARLESRSPSRPLPPAPSTPRKSISAAQPG
jgi:predicted RNase H-like HicB family nuclease